MPSITLTDPVTGTTIASGLIATNNANLRNLLNSGLDPVNLKGNPALVAGDVPVWDGTNFVKPTGTPSATTFLRGDKTWGPGAYTAYTPTWATTGTAPAYGNAVVVGQYLQIGKLVHTYGRVTFGSTSTFGTLVYSFSLPVTASAAAVSAPAGGMGQGADASAGFSFFPLVYLANSTTLRFEYAATYLGADQAVAHNSPWVWAQGDIISWNITYEAA